MPVFYATLASTYIFYLLARISYDRKFKILATFWSIIVALILIFVSGLRSGIGDTRMYMHSYELAVANPSSLNFDRDAGFNLLSLLLIHVSSNPQILIFTTALINNLFNVLMFNKYRSYLELEVFMYITSGYYFVTMNGIRQCLAAALLFACTKFISDGKFIKYCICVLLIMTLHQSAFMMIPLYFVFRQEAWSKKMMLFIIVAVIGILLYNVLSPILFKALENTNYGGYSDFNEGGSSVLRTVINAIPVVLAYLKRDKLKEKFPESNVLINMSIVSLIFVALGMFNWIFNRFALYLQLANFVLVPYIIRYCFEGKERRVIYFGFIVCYSALFYIESDLMAGMTYPTKFKFNDFIFSYNG